MNQELGNLKLDPKDQDTYENLTALPSLVATVLHDISNCVFGIQLKTSAAEKTGSLSGEDLTIVCKRTQELFDILQKAGPYFQYDFRINTKETGSLTTFLDHQLAQLSLRWPQINTDYQAPPEITINWVRLKQIFVPILKALNSKKPHNPSAPLTLRTFMSDTHTDCLVLELLDESIAVDVDGEGFLLRPFKEALQKRTPKEMAMATCLARTGNISALCQASPEGTTLVRMEITLNGY